MSRWLWPWSNCVKERVCRYLLQHYLGHFFQEHLSLDQLSLDLYKGSVVLRDIHLETWVRRHSRGGIVRREGARATKGSSRKIWAGGQTLCLERPVGPRQSSPGPLAGPSPLSQKLGVPVFTSLGEGHIRK